MINLEQAAKEYANKNHFRFINNIEREVDIKAFEAGAEFAQQWISVEDELPPVDELVLTKTIIDEVIYYSLDWVICIETDDETFEQYPSWREGRDWTHWRPINIV